MQSNQKTPNGTVGFAILRLFAAAILLACLFQAIAAWRSDFPASARSAGSLLETQPASHLALCNNPPILRTVPIARIVPGMRVLAENPKLNGSQLGESDIDPEMWRLVSLTISKPNDGVLDIKLLRPRVWFIGEAWKLDLINSSTGDFEAIAQALVGQRIRLDMSEMGAEGLATITEIAPCPEIENVGHPGRYVVTGTFRHSAANILYLDIEGEVGSIGVTDNHLFWSADRQHFIPAGELRIGEHLRRADGTPAKLLRSTRKRGPPATVYNLEVDAQHTYHVGLSGILVHNKYEGDEIVYALFKKGKNGGADEIVYYGISTDTGRRIREHVADGKDFDYLMELTNPLKHDAARSLEGGLMRDRLLSVFNRTDEFADSIKETLERAGLLNRNRGRIPSNWIGGHNLDDLKGNDVWDLLKDDGNIIYR
jgi:hypothetical protein